MNRREFFSRSAVGVGMGMAARGQASGPGLKIGFCERDITPDIGMQQPGGYLKSYLRTYHDPCKVRAAVYDKGEHTVAVVTVDALIAPRTVVVAARKAIQQQCGLAPESVLISASHAHTSGPVAMVLPGEYDHASPFVRQLAYKVSSCADAGYLARVTNEIVVAVCHAHSFRVPARCSFGAGSEDKVAFNRRFRMKNGMVWTHPGHGNPDVLGPAGP